MNFFENQSEILNCRLKNLSLPEIPKTLFENTNNGQTFVCVDGLWSNGCCNDLSSAAENAQAVFIDGALSRLSNPKALIALCGDKIKESGVLIVAETVTDIEDAFLNSLEFKINNDHVRFYTVKEIISQTENLFAPLYFATFPHCYSIEDWAKGSSLSPDNIKSVINTFPNHIKEKIYNGADCKIIKTKGVFVFRKI